MTVAIDSSGDTTKYGARRGGKTPTGSDLPYRVVLWVVTGFFASVMIVFAGSLVWNSIPGWQAAGLYFFYGTTWDSTIATFGALPFILGTLITTVLAVLVAAPLGIGGALAIVFVIPRRLRAVVSSLVELLAVIPSIIYGIWGYLVLLPLMDQKIQPWLASKTGGHWPFAEQGVGKGLLLGSVILAVMILPTVTAISRDVLAGVPHDLVEGALSLGATKGQVLAKVVVPAARPGLIGAVVLGTARALGETIALTLVLGGASPLHPIPTNLFATLDTLATSIVNNWGDLTGSTSVGALYCLALTLAVIVGTVNFSARRIIRRSARRLQ